MRSLFLHPELLSCVKKSKIPFWPKIEAFHEVFPTQLGLEWPKMYHKSSSMQFQSLCEHLKNLDFSATPDLRVMQEARSLVDLHFICFFRVCFNWWQSMAWAKRNRSCLSAFFVPNKDKANYRSAVTRFYWCPVGSSETNQGRDDARIDVSPPSIFNGFCLEVRSVQSFCSWSFAFGLLFPFAFSLFLKWGFGLFRFEYFSWSFVLDLLYFSLWIFSCFLHLPFYFTFCFESWVSFCTTNYIIVLSTWAEIGTQLPPPSLKQSTNNRSARFTIGCGNSQNSVNLLISSQN